MDKVNTAMEVNKVFKEKGTCAQTYFFILNRYFKNANEIYESASDLLAGGIMNRGYQCGMLWGSSLAVGMDSFRRYGNCPQGWNRTIETTRKICESFSRRTGTNNCRDYTGCDLTSILGFVKFTWLSFSKGLENSPCFKLAGMWVEEAIQTASENLNNKSSNLNEPALNCASVTAEKLGASDEEIAIVAGFAGGLGLQGNACGALAALIWIKMVRWCERNPGKKAPYFNNKTGKSIVKEFLKVTNAEVACSRICGRMFNSVKELSDFIEQGGCKKIIDCLASM